jgi:putative cell wall-binding protein
VAVLTWASVFFAFQGWSSDPAQAATTTVVRYAGSDRYATAADTSAATFQAPVPVVFVARGDDFPDALAAGPAAAIVGGPVLLVGATVPASTAAELTRLRPGRIVVLGGPLAVPDPVVAALSAFTSGPVSRLAGTDRYATAAAISASTFTPGVGAVFIASGESFPDALAGAASAGHQREPILLMQSSQVPAATAQELTRLRPQSIVILGGVNTVSEKIAGLLAAYTSGAVSRLAGDDRYGTAVALSQQTYPTGSSTLFLATGLDFADALGGGVAAALAPAPLLLVPGTCVPPVVGAEIDRLVPARIVILGGELAVGTGVESLTPCPG